MLFRSPRPIRVIEYAAIVQLLENHHVVAGGGGGVPCSNTGQPAKGVVDKDWVAALLAVSLSADHLVFATNVAGVYERPDEKVGVPIPWLSVASAQSLIRSGAATPGAMAPKLESAAEFASTTHKPALICALDQIEHALAGRAGTRVG